MNHRHLYPNEFDLLLDGDGGFGLAPLRAHVQACAECSAELEHARQMIALLDELPHFAPSPLFTERVMGQVEVFEPWHVTLRDNLRTLVPQSRPARVLAAAGGFATALAVSVVSVLLLGRLDLVVFGWGLAVERGRSVAVELIGEAVSTVFGEAALRALATAGPAGILIGLAVFTVSLLVAAALLRTAAVASRGMRS